MPLVFEMRVLEKYVQAGNVVYRTNSAGRVDAKVWRVDFGIVDVAGVIHAQAGDVFKLPQAEREHWAAHIAAPPLNARFLKMRLGLGACIDEGDIELWDGTPR
ncbi:MAG TPA: hypothetical protein VFK80_11885 [Limnochordia bacterium]|nr:hypothetical protein [Limnochordia bacterium]